MQRKAKVLCQLCGWQFCGFCALSKRIDTRVGPILACGPLKDYSDLDRHVVDCGDHLRGANKWRQALHKYVEMYGALYPKLDQEMGIVSDRCAGISIKKNALICSGHTLN